MTRRKRFGPPSRMLLSTDIRLSEVLSALSAALDLTEGQPIGHSARTCLVGMRIAEELGLGLDERSDLFYALLLKDAGCSSNAAKVSALFAAHDQEVKRDRKTTHWPRTRDSLGHVLRSARPNGSLLERARQMVAVSRSGAEGTRELTQLSCERGAGIARSLGFPLATAEAIRGLDEHWDGAGYPAGLTGGENSLLGRILGLAQTVEVYSVAGREIACEMARARSGTWFDPALVDAFEAVEHDEDFWADLTLEGDELQLRVATMEPEDRVLEADEETLDRVSEAFAQVVDAKSPWTYRHSLGVARVAVGIAEVLDLPVQEVRDLRRAALLHDIGKLGVSNRILDKAEKLTADEWRIMRRHPAHTALILRRVPRLDRIAEVAASHHERLDGRGYHRGLDADDLSLPARILAVADMYEALSVERPYRGALAPDQVLEIMGRQVGAGLCATSFAALEEWLPESSPAVASESAALLAALA